MSRSSFRHCVVLGLAALLISGCSGETPQVKPEEEAKQKVRPPQAQVKAEPEPKEAQPEDRFVYDPSGRRDPFEALLTVRRPIAQESVPLTPLQEYDLGQFRLIGAIIGKGVPKAMVEAPGGKPFMLKKGVKIGKNNGVVQAITSTEVVVEEKYYDFSGAVRTSINKIQFPPREGVN